MNRPAWAGRIAAIAVASALVVVQGQGRPADTIAGLFDQYLHGDADAAVAALAAWPASRREAESGINPVPGDLWSDAAFALFHTEVGFRAGRLGQWRREVTGPPLQQREIHFRTSYQLIDRIAAATRDRGDERLLAFAKSWCIVSVSWQLRTSWYAADEELFDDLVRHRFPDDPELLLLMASIQEPRIGPNVEERDGIHFVAVNGAGPAANGVMIQATKVRTSSHGVFNYDRNADLERDLRRAVAIDPGLLEARLRLGRHLILMDQDAQGVAALEQTVTDARTTGNTFAGYVAALFAGDWYEHHDQGSKAAEAYRAASVFLPDAPAARLALGRLDIVSGRSDIGWAGIRGMFGTDAASGETAVDPWVDYLAGQAWQIRSRLAGLRAAVHIAGSRAIAATARPAESVPRPTHQATQAGAQVAGVQSAAGGFRTAVDGVRVDVYVTDGGKPITGLSAADFEVRDNNVVQGIDSALGVASLSVAIVLDLSSSMNTSGLAALKEAGQAVARALRPGDLASLLTFDEKIALVVRSTTRAYDIEKALAGVRQYPSHSVLWDATIAGAAFAVEAPGRPVVIALTDLGENASWLTQSPQVRSPRGNRTAVVDLLRRTGVMLDLVSVDFAWRPSLERSDALGHIDDYTVGSRAGRETTDLTGGEFFPGTQPDFQARINSHFAELRSGYVLTFMPTGVKQDDGWHKITVRLKQGKGKVSARPGYYATDVKRGR